MWIPTIKILLSSQLSVWDPGRRDRKKIVNYFKILEADFNIYHRQKTPLHFYIERDRYPTANLLIKAGANPSARDGEGNTPLMTAITCSGDISTIELLIKYGVDLLAVNIHGKTAAQYADENHRYGVLIRIRKALK